jgi:hypothetical protein
LFGLPQINPTPQKQGGCMPAVIVPTEMIENKILLIRGKKVMMDHDLASLYDVETKSLNRAVKRNRDRFPEDFMFQLTKKEHDFLRCQFGTSNKGRGGQRYLLFVFTQEGIAIFQNKVLWNDAQCFDRIRS